MPIYERASDRGARRARFLTGRIVSELVTRRREAGMSQRELGRLVHASHTKVGRLEAGGSGLTFDLAARMAAVLGLQLSAALHPDGDPVRDTAHLALMARLRRRVGSAVRWQSEVPIPIEGDRRSADAIVEGPTLHALIEAETRLEDIQALERRIGAKQRDLGLERSILLVADTRHNRTVVAHHDELRARFPVSTRACLAALTRGRDPGGDAMVIL